MSWRRGLFASYFAPIVALVTTVLVASNGLNLWFSYHESEKQLVALQREKAAAAAIRIEHYIKDIDEHLGWTTLSIAGNDSIEQHRLDYFKLLRLVPPVSEVAWIDAKGREQLRVSRLDMESLHSNADFSGDIRYTTAKSGKTYFGLVYFRSGTEPYMSIAHPSKHGGATIAEVNLKFVWNVISEIKIGKAGLAYAVDGSGILIAHPDISLVLRKTDLSGLAQAAALKDNSTATGTEAHKAKDMNGRSVLTAQAAIPAFGWRVIVESPTSEAFASIHNTFSMAAMLLVIGLIASTLVSLVLARKMIQPIRMLQDGATRIGNGDLSQRLEMRTGNEIEELADQFNGMAEKLAESHASLERKVEERTLELKKSLTAQASAEERQRIMRDMHDGFGSQLISSLVMVEHGKSGQAEIAQLLRQCIDDLRLTIDALTSGDDGDQTDLLHSLGMLRDRLEPRLHAAGITLRWHCTCPDATLAMAPRAALALLRIVQEAVCNAIKHAGATAIEVEVTAGDKVIEARIFDNGKGFDASAPAQGRGMTNMKNRAREFGGLIEVTSSGTGTCLRLVIPRLTDFATPLRAGQPGEASSPPLGVA